MTPFDYIAAPDQAAALARAASAEFIAGGTDMLQLLQEGVRAPSVLLDINRLPLAGITAEDDAVRIGALTRLNDVADDRTIQDRFPVLAQALRETASPQVRNMATVGGNLLQRTRCLYFRDVATPCNKREPGSGCPAQDGQNRINAILGGSEHCIAVQPSDMAVALVVLEAEILVAGPSGERRIPAEEFHRLPGDTPQIETVLRPEELITAIRIPVVPGRRSHYVKVRDRASFEWALASCAVALTLDGGVVRQARIAAGGVATKPWRLPRVEAALQGKPLDTAHIQAAAELAAEGAVPRSHNAYKIPLLKRSVARALTELGGQP